MKALASWMREATERSTHEIIEWMKDLEEKCRGFSRLFDTGPRLIAGV